MKAMWIIKFCGRATQIVNGIEHRAKTLEKVPRARSCIHRQRRSATILANQSYVDNECTKYMIVDLEFNSPDYPSDSSGVEIVTTDFMYRASQSGSMALLHCSLLIQK